MLVWDVEELYSTGLPDQNQQVSIVVVSAMLAVRWLEANADTSEQETAMPTPEQRKDEPQIGSFQNHLKPLNTQSH